MTTESPPSSDDTKPDPEIDPEPFVLADYHSAFRNTAALKVLEIELRKQGFDEGEIEDRAIAAADRWDAICNERHEAWETWAERTGHRVVEHVTRHCGGRVQRVGPGSRRGWWCRLCNNTLDNEDVALRTRLPERDD